MSDKKLPVLQVPLSELVTLPASNVAIDLDDTIDRNSQTLLATSFTELDHANQTHMPFYNLHSLSQAIGTDMRPLKEVLANADEDERRWKNNEPYLRQDVTVEFLLERLEQPRDTSQQALTKSTIDTVNKVAPLSYTDIVNKISNPSDGL
ncbi:hypothetical protein [Aeromonas veronii]|uniref:Uncharacterized protein n=1 Tax=Aeromonas veronii TaxID=654 RepID=A0A4S5CGN6_AERVE|nr:hypothetical protein [Aeromonas veronii]THJ43603.1 hypothetical protein E8Q35_14955 [Aeromonas veronii]